LLAKNAFDDALEPARDAISQMEQRFIENAEPVIAAMNTKIQEVAPVLADAFECPEPAEAYDDDSMYDSKRSYVDQVDRFREHQGEDPDVSLGRDRVVSVNCSECGTMFQAPRYAGAKFCRPRCKDKAQYRRRTERMRQADKQGKGDSHD
jgi:hypothetical protein